MRTYGAPPQEGELRCPCGSALERVTLPEYDFTAAAGYPCILRNVEALRCPKDGKIALDGQVCEAALEQIARTLAESKEPMDNDGARFLRKAEDYQREVVATWNANHPIGTPVRYWPGVREGAGRVGITRTPAWLMGKKWPAVSVSGYAGGIHLTHVEVVDPALDAPAPALALKRQEGEGDEGFQQRIVAFIGGQDNFAVWETWNLFGTCLDQHAREVAWAKEKNWRNCHWVDRHVVDTCCCPPRLRRLLIEAQHRRDRAIAAQTEAAADQEKAEQEIVRLRALLAEEVP